MRRHKLIITAAALAFLFTLMQLTGFSISMKYNTSMHTMEFVKQLTGLSIPLKALLGLLEFAAWTAAFAAAFRWLDRRKHNADISDRKSRSIGWDLIPAVFLLLCWLPSLLGAYPGYYNYDISGQLPQVMYDSVPYNTHHPLLHTLIAGHLINWGYELLGESMEKGVLLYSVFQMTVCAFFFARFIRYIWNLTGRKWLAAAAFCYYAFSPVIVMFTMSTTKDVLCSLALQAGVILLHELYREPDTFTASPKSMAGLTALLVLACLLRNNIIYAVLAFAPFCILMGKGTRKRLAVLSGSILLLSLGINHGLAAVLHAQPGSMREAFSVPFQQVARVYGEYGPKAFDESETALLEAAGGREVLLSYDPFNADNVKNNLDFDAISGHGQEYVKLWLTKGLQYPAAYLWSFLENTYQAWYPWTSVVDEAGSGHIYYFDCRGDEPVGNSPKIPRIYEFYRKISEDFSYQKYPVIRLLFSTGAMLWATLFTLFYGIWKKDRGIVMALSFVMLLCLTALLGPVALVRYYLVLFYGFPVYAGLLLKGENVGERDLEE